MPVKNNNDTLGQIIEVTIPFEFKRTFNTRAYEGYDSIEIRNYGKFTVGRSGLTRADFFNYIREENNNLINFDEENKEYVTIFLIKDGKLSKEDFANSLINFTYLIKEFKDGYRKK